jgi:hypothetical protein
MRSTATSFRIRICSVVSLIRLSSNQGWSPYSAAAEYENVIYWREGNKIEIICWREANKEAAAGRFIREFVQQKETRPGNRERRGQGTGLSGARWMVGAQTEFREVSQNGVYTMEPVA